MKVRLGGAGKLDRQRCPITSGEHTMAELAALIQQGKTLKDIAGSWGMRALAGRYDLQQDIWTAWGNAGSPGGIPEPSNYDPESQQEWARWRAARDRAIESWLDTFVDSDPCPRCGGSGRGGRE